MGCGLFLFRLVGVCSSSSELVFCFSRWCFGQWIMWVIFEMIFKAGFIHCFKQSNCEISTVGNGF
jgi:hypothetical protein